MNIKRKGMIPQHAAKIIKSMIELGKKIMLNPHLYVDKDDVELENVYLSPGDLHSIGVRETGQSVQQ